MHEWQRIRDIPRSCLCIWLWKTDRAGYVRTRPDLNCPWHLVRL